MARILITGASGLLGINLASEALRGHEVIGVDRGRLKSAPFQVFSVDPLRGNTIVSVLDTIRPDWMVNCAAVASLEECDQNPEHARRVNTDIPGELARLSAQQGIRFVHISTDAVFNGKKQDFYTEEDEPSPLGTYSQTKLDGERAVHAANSDAIVARVNFFGWSLNGRRSLAELFVNNLSAGKHMNGFTDVVFCPMFVGHTARILLAMLEKGLSGLYHVVGPQPMSKYQFGLEIAKKFGLRESQIDPKSVLASELTARRAHNLRLSVHKLFTDLEYQIPTFSAGLDEFYTQYQQDYPQQIRAYLQ